MKFLWLIVLFWVSSFQRLGAHPSIPQKVISLSPNLTEMIYDVGAQGQLVGDTDYCRFPPAAMKKAKIGGWLDPSIEKIVSLKPDLVLALPFHEKTVNLLRKLQIPVVVLNCGSIEDVLSAYDRLGELLGHRRQAQVAREDLVRRLESIQQMAKGKKKLSILFVVGRTPGTLDQIYAAGGHNFINELIEMAGGENVMADAPTSYPLVSKEELISRNPDVIVDSVLSHEVQAKDLEKKNVWDQMPELQAVEKRHVYYFSNPDLLIPGPSMVRLGEFLCHTFEKARQRP